MYKILIVEDDRGVAQGISDFLETWDLQTCCAEDFSAVAAEFARFDPHLVLMDISLPYKNGFYWCQEIRKASKVPVIFISSASDNMNIIMAMNYGADDFIPKPFDLNILTAKIQALLRRTYDYGQTVPVYEHRGAMLNTGEGTLYYQDRKIDLSKNEFKILSVLMENKGKTVSREKLMEALWQSDEFVDENTLTVNIGRLRKRLDQAGLDHFITTKFGKGYFVG
ncbi:MAG: response regulator transcription factor [Erysipelotrichaceae bacterium]|nr:response regulator transcription factor [Erysipelotrichaceae bacterium]